MNQVQPIVFSQSNRHLVEPRLMLLLALCASVVLPPEIFSGVATIMMLWCLFFSPLRPMGLALKLAAPFLALGALGLIMAGDNAAFSVWRDVWYVVKLCVCLMLGMLIGLRQENPESIHRVLIIFAVFSALYTFVAMLAETYFAIDLSGEKREVVGLSLAALGAVPSLIDKIIVQRGPRRWANGTFLLLIVGAAITSDSRITLSGFAIMLVAWKGEFSTLRRTAVAVIALAIVGAILWQFLPEYTGGELNALTKLRRSFEEMSFTDSYDHRSMIFNWRGFEAYNAQLMFESSSAFKKLFGSGLGSEINIGLSVQMSQDMTYQFLPTIHNGFYYILIKFGIVGLAVYTLALLSWLRWGRRDFDASNLEDRVLRGLIVVVLASTAVITGLYNKEELNSVSILIAFLIGFGYRRHHDLVHRLARRRAAPAPVAAPARLGVT